VPEEALEEGTEESLEEMPEEALEVVGTCRLNQQTARGQIIYDLVSCSKTLALQK
jgi:hypothetical protein